MIVAQLCVHVGGNILNITDLVGGMVYGIILRMECSMSHVLVGVTTK